MELGDREGIKLHRAMQSGQWRPRAGRGERLTGHEDRQRALSHMCDLMCRGGGVATNLAIDDKLILEAQRIGGHRTKKSAVTEALKEYIQRRLFPLEPTGGGRTL